MTLLRVSLVDFLNARPLTWGLLKHPPADVSVSRDLPSICADKLASGEVDAGLIPSIEYQRIMGLRAVASLGIAASSEVRSVLLVSDVSRERIGSVDLDPASRTSAVLTRILLKRVYGLEPEYREAEGGRRKAEDKGSGPPPASRLPPHDPPDARLIIGDPALKARLNGHVVLDLAAEWRAFTGHSFVFAFWAVRKDADTRRAAEVLRASRASAREELDRLVAEESARSGLSAAVVRDYLLHSLHYELDDRDREGLELFYRMAREEKLIDAVRPIDTV